MRKELCRQVIVNVAGVPGDLAMGTIEHHPIPPFGVFGLLATEDEPAAVFRTAPAVIVKKPEHRGGNEQRNNIEHTLQRVL